MNNKTSKIALLVTTVIIATSLLLSACGGPSKNPDGSVNVEVTLTDFKIESSLDTFEVGVLYHFIITNEGQVNHELMIMQPMMEGMMDMTMEEMATDLEQRLKFKKGSTKMHFVPEGAGRQEDGDLR